MDPAQATECRGREVWQKWMELAQAYCGPNGRWLPKTKLVLKDAGGAVLGEPKREWKGVALNPAALAMEEDKHPEKTLDERVSQACSDKDTVAAFEDAAKTNPFDVKPVFRTHPHRWDLLIKSHNPETFGCTTCRGGTCGARLPWSASLRRRGRWCSRTFPGCAT